jgi:hypothetical protein
MEKTITSNKETMRSIHPNIITGTMQQTVGE